MQLLFGQAAGAWWAEGVLKSETQCFEHVGNTKKETPGKQQWDKYLRETQLVGAS